VSTFAANRSDTGTVRQRVVANLGRLDRLEPSHLDPLALPAFTSYTHFSQLLGYAFPRIDTDGDGLIDGFEVVLGTDPGKVHSDTDGIADGVEYPPNGIPATSADPRLPGGCQ